MKRRTFLSALAAAATPLAVTACNDGSIASPDAIDLPAPSYAQSAQWSPMTSGDLQFSLSEGGQGIEATNLSGGARWSYGQSFDDLNGVTDLAWHDDALAVVDSGNRRIVRLNADGQRIGVWTDERFERLHSAVSFNGALYVTDTLAHCVWRIDARGDAQQLFGQLGGSEGELNGPRGLSLTSEGQLVIVDAGNRRVVVHGTNGAFVREWSVAGFESPRYVVVDRTDTVHVSDAVSGSVWAFSLDGRLVREHVPVHAQSTTPTIRGLALDARGDVVVTLRG